MNSHVESPLFCLNSSQMKLSPSSIRKIASFTNLCPLLSHSALSPNQPGRKFPPPRTSVCLSQRPELIPRRKKTQTWVTAIVLRIRSLMGSRGVEGVSSSVSLKWVRALCCVAVASNYCPWWYLQSQVQNIRILHTTPLDTIEKWE